MFDSSKIKTVDGDPTVDFEFKELFKTYSQEAFLANIVTGRLMWGLKGKQITDNVEIKKSVVHLLKITS